MKEYVVKDKEFIILSSVVTNATKCTVTETDDKYFKVQLKTGEKYTPGETVDMFTTAGSGILYFETELKAAEGKILTLQVPETHRLIQRREYTRVEINKNMLLQDEGKNIRITVTDISAGGMRFQTEERLEVNKDYKAQINLDKNTFISCRFRPVRIDAEKGKDSKYTVSGKFKTVKNSDRITLVQYCFGKEAETKSK